VYFNWLQQGSRYDRNFIGIEAKTVSKGSMEKNNGKQQFFPHMLLFAMRSNLRKKPAENSEMETEREQKVKKTKMF